jgi:uncharacterized protein
MSGGRKYLPVLIFPADCFDTRGQKYYHGALMFAPAVIDSLEFARTGERLSGSLPVSSFPRLEDVVAEKGGDIAYVVAGAMDAHNRPMLKLHVRGTLILQCQRCLGMLEYPLDVASSVLVVPQGTAPEDADDPDAPDYIEAQRELNLAELIEDEILLCVPFAPRHERKCGESRPDESGGKQGKDSPFAALAALKNTTKT